MQVCGHRNDAPRLPEPIRPDQRYPGENYRLSLAIVDACAFHTTRTAPRHTRSKRCTCVAANWQGGRTRRNGVVNQVYRLWCNVI